VKELSDLETKLMSISFDCGSEESDRFMELLERIKPKECTDLFSSSAAMIEYYRSADGSSEAYATCMEQNHQFVAAPVIEMCKSGNITLQAAFVEVNNRIELACTEYSPSK
jgi:hypothetical protein